MACGRVVSSLGYFTTVAGTQQDESTAQRGDCVSPGEPSSQYCKQRVCQPDRMEEELSPRAHVSYVLAGRNLRLDGRFDEDGESESQ